VLAPPQMDRKAAPRKRERLDHTRLSLAAVSTVLPLLLFFRGRVSSPCTEVDSPPTQTSTAVLSSLRLSAAGVKQPAFKVEGKPWPSCLSRFVRGDMQGRSEVGPLLQWPDIPVTGREGKKQRGPLPREECGELLTHSPLRIECKTWYRRAVTFGQIASRTFPSLNTCWPSTVYPGW